MSKSRRLAGRERWRGGIHSLGRGAQGDV